MCFEYRRDYIKLSIMSVVVLKLTVTCVAACLAELFKAVTCVAACLAELYKTVTCIAASLAEL